MKFVRARERKKKTKSKKEGVKKMERKKAKPTVLLNRDRKRDEDKLIFLCSVL